MLQLFPATLELAVSAGATACLKTPAMGETIAETEALLQLLLIVGFYAVHRVNLQFVSYHTVQI